MRDFEQEIVVKIHKIERDRDSTLQYSATKIVTRVTKK